MIPLRIALLGAGIFAREAHLPALAALRDQFEIVAIFSRTRERAVALAAQLENPPVVYTDLAALLAREDIEAVDIVLPIAQLPAAVEMALAAGKHVISEKPVAPTVAEGRRLLPIYQKYPSQVWMVAENWRYEAAFVRASEVIGEIGRPLACHWALHIPVTPENKYYHSEWRRTGTFPGGLLLDTGVHHAAVFRQILGEITRVSAFTAHMHPDLPPADTLTAALAFETGLIGHYSASYTAPAPVPTYLMVVGERGGLRVGRGFLQVTVDSETSQLPLAGYRSVNAELSAFEQIVRGGVARDSTPQDALQDVAVIEAMLRSAETGKAVEVERIV